MGLRPCGSGIGQTEYHTCTLTVRPKLASKLLDMRRPFMPGLRGPVERPRTGLLPGDRADRNLHGALRPAGFPLRSPLRPRLSSIITRRAPASSQRKPRSSRHRPEGSHHRIGITEHHPLGKDLAALADNADGHRIERNVSPPHRRRIMPISSCQVGSEHLANVMVGKGPGRSAAEPNTHLFRRPTGLHVHPLQGDGLYPLEIRGSGQTVPG